MRAEIKKRRHDPLTAKALGTSDLENQPSVYACEVPESSTKDEARKHTKNGKHAAKIAYEEQLKADMKEKAKLAFDTI